MNVGDECFLVRFHTRAYAGLPERRGYYRSAYPSLAAAQDMIDMAKRSSLGAAHSTYAIDRGHVLAVVDGCPMDVQVDGTGPVRMP